MRNHRNNVHETCLTVIMITHQLGEAYQPPLIEGPYENATLVERCLDASYGVPVFAVMHKRPSLADTRFIVDVIDAVDQCVIQRNFATGHTFLLCTTDHIPRLAVYLFRPPLIECRNR